MAGSVPRFECLLVRAVDCLLFVLVDHTIIVGVRVHLGLRGLADLCFHEKQLSMDRALNVSQCDSPHGRTPRTRDAESA